MALMPVDPSDPLYGILNPGMPNFGGLSGIFSQRGQGQSGGGFRGLLSDPNLGLALLANSYGPKRSFGQIFGESALQAKQMSQQGQDDELRRKLMQAQIRNYDEPNGAAQTPSSVREYEYAKRNGYAGSFQDWIVAGGQTSRPSAVQEWEFYNKLADEEKRAYLEMKRTPPWKVDTVNQAPTVIQGLPGGRINTIPLSTTKSEITASADRKEAEARQGAIGTGAGGIVADITKKGSSAQSVNGMLDIAEPLIDISTGSGFGAGVDKVAAFFGQSLDGAQAIASLKTLEGQLIAQMPRMEGPQSDADRLLYQQSAGAIADPSVPRETRKAAIKTIRRLQDQYKARAASVNQSATPAQPSLDDIRKKYGRKP